MTNEMTFHVAKMPDGTYVAESCATGAGMSGYRAVGDFCLRMLGQGTINCPKPPCGLPLSDDEIGRLRELLQK